MAIADTAHTSIGKFRVRGMLAAGGACDRYAAITSDGTDALIVVPRDCDDEGHALFLEEARRARDVSHPRLQRLIEAGTDGDAAFAAYVAVGGESIAVRVGAGGANVDQRIAPETTKRIMLDVLEALEAMHAASICHRGVSPHSVVLDDEGRAVLAEPGVHAFAEQWRMRPGCRGPAAPAQPLMPWMSPEAISGRAVDARVDVYGAGALLYWLLTERHAFAGCSEMEKLESIVRRVPPRPVMLRRGVPAGLSDISMKALEKEPACRFDSVIAMREAVRASSLD